MRSVLVAMVLLSIPVWVHGMEGSFDLRPGLDGQIDTLTLTANGFTATPGTDILWQTIVRRPGTDYLRLHIIVENSQQEDFVLTIKDGSNTLVMRHDKATLPARVFWTPLIYSERALVRLSATQVPQSLALTIDRVAFRTDGISWESIIDDPEFEPVVRYADDADITRVARAVAKLSFFNDGFVTCTGFLIDADHLITNHHCVATKEVCETTMAIFCYQEGIDGSIPDGSQYACESVVKADYELDYAILKIAGSPGTQWGFLQLEAHAVTASQPIYVVQHPNGDPKQIVIKNCVVMDTVAVGREAGSDFTHNCDTLDGSSGSPMLTLEHEFVGLHHFGINQADFWDRNRAVIGTKVAAHAAP